MCASALLGSGGSPHPGGRTVTIKAVFKYLAPDGTTKPIRLALAELRNLNPISDDVIARSPTGFDGSVTFQYDADRSDGLLGGRIDPYVRCYPKLAMPSYELWNASGGTGWTELARVGMGTGFAYLEPAYHTVSTPTWDDNESDRTAEVIATGDAAKTFFILDCAAEANLPTSGENPRAPMALGSPWVFPGATFDTGLPKTAYAPDTNVILIDFGELEFDTTLHEYGHYEMARSYGGYFGSYDCTRNNHSFEEPLKNKWYLPSDAEWSALAEGWADFCPVITKRLPIYRIYNVETATGANLADASASCEGTVCRVFWDIADTWRDKTLDLGKKPVDRPLAGGLALDDDPFGFANRGPFSSLPGWDAVKDIIRRDRPKSLWAIRDGWRSKYAGNRSALRALNAVYWMNGLLRGDIQENAPSCALHVSGRTVPVTVGGEARDAYAGDVILTADVDDLEADDRPFLHVRFYWDDMSERSRPPGAISPDRSSWHLIGVDVDGSDGFTCEWPEGPDRPLPGKRVCLIALASDFMMESAYALSLDPETRAGGQVWDVLFSESESGGLIAEEFKGLTTAPMIVAGPHAMVLRADGTVLSWGSAQKGIMGNGIKTRPGARINVPTAAPRLNGIVALTGDSGGAAALRKDGTVWAWGRSLLKDRSAAERGLPVRIEGLDGVQALSSHGETALAIRSDGTLWGWHTTQGANTQTSLGFNFGIRVKSDSPIPLPGLKDITAVQAGPGWSLAIDRSGDVWSFGPAADRGQLGRGDVSDKPLPKKVAGPRDAVSIAAGWYHSLAACRDGSVWAWGAGDMGALGDGTLQDRPAATRVGSLDGVKAVAAGRYFSLALREDGTVWAWGSGFLGVSDDPRERYLIRQTTPRKVLNLSGITAISAGEENALALREDGTVWAWGRNDWGAIGDGTWKDRPLPVQVPGVKACDDKK